MFVRWDDIDRSADFVEDLRRHMERLFEDFGVGQTAVGQTARPGGPWPRILFRDEGETLKLTAEVPGLCEKDVKLTVNRDVLAVEGERKVEAPKGYSVHRQERTAVRFARSFSLPCPIDAEKVQATIRDGVLTVAMPKAPEAQPRRITVQTQ
jgi:HSP20 family protein